MAQPFAWNSVLPDFQFSVKYTRSRGRPVKFNIRDKNMLQKVQYVILLHFLCAGDHNFDAGVEFGYTEYM